MLKEQDSPTRNHTLTLSAEERRQLRCRLLTEADVNATNYTDRTIFGDTLHVLQLLPDAFADLIFVDPPYNLSKQFGSTRFGARSALRYEEYVNSWLDDVCKKLKPHGTLYFCADWRTSAVVQQALERRLTLLNRITWQREKGRGSERNWKNCMEDIWMGVNDARHYTFNAAKVMLMRRVKAPYRIDGQPKDWQETGGQRLRQTYASNLWDDLCVPFWSMPENTPHPTQKPEKLLAKLILASTNENDMVFDPFLGSGTASVVARKLGRHYCGIEREEDYSLMAEKRLLRAELDCRIQGFSDGVFWERNSNPKSESAN